MDVGLFGSDNIDWVTADEDEAIDGLESDDNGVIGAGDNTGQSKSLLEAELLLLECKLNKSNELLDFWGGIGKILGQKIGLCGAETGSGFFLSSFTLNIIRNNIIETG